MRIWTCIEPRDLCRQHLLAQWREGLGLLRILQRIQAGDVPLPWDGRLVINGTWARVILLKGQEVVFGGQA